MTSPFLDAARQGRSGWKSYLFGTILLLVAPTFVFFILFFILYIFLFIILSIIYPPFGEIVQQGGDISKFFQSYLYKKIYGFPYFALFFCSFYAMLFTVTLVFILEHIHERKFLSLFGSTNIIRWRRVRDGFVVYFSILTITFSFFYLLNPSRYKLSFVLSHWIVSLPFSFLLSGILALILCFLFYGYFLQGFSSFIKKPLRLMFCYGIIIATLRLILSSEPNPLQWINIIFFALFTVGITLKDEGFELLLGLFTAGRFFLSAILQNSSNELQTPAIFIREATTDFSEVLKESLRQEKRGQKIVF